MKKCLKSLGLLSIIVMLAACNHGNTPSSTEKFTSTKVYNPNTTKVKLISVAGSRSADEEEICEVEPLQSEDVELGDEHTYYFTDADGNKIADLDIGKDGRYHPVYLELNEPKDGVDYLFLNQYKNTEVLEEYPRNEGGKSYNTYGLLLYEVVDENAPDAYKTKDADGKSIYVRTYPSANYWFDSEIYAANYLGKKITYDDAFKNSFTALSEPWPAWGWATKNAEFNDWFCHRVVSYIMHVEDSAIVGLDEKHIDDVCLIFYWWNPAGNGWNPAWYYTSYTILEDNVSNKKTQKHEADIVQIMEENNCSGPFYFLFYDPVNECYYLAIASRDVNNDPKVTIGKWAKVSVTTRQD